MLFEQRDLANSLESSCLRLNKVQEWLGLVLPRCSGGSKERASLFQGLALLRAAVCDSYQILSCKILAMKEFFFLVVFVTWERTVKLE